MKNLIPLISAVALALIVIPTLMYLGESMDKPTLQSLMLLGTVLWFISAPFWMGRSNDG